MSSSSYYPYVSSYNYSRTSGGYYPYPYQYPCDQQPYPLYQPHWLLDPQVIRSTSNLEPFQYARYQSHWLLDPEVISSTSNLQPAVQYSNGRIYAQFSDMTIIVDEEGEIIDDYSQFYDEEKVKKGLINREETILKHLKTRNHLKSKDDAESHEPEICVICQAEYEDRERIGKLQCGHDYHVDCIKKWLLQNTLCPICNTIALPTKKL